MKISRESKAILKYPVDVISYQVNPTYNKVVIKTGKFSMYSRNNPIWEKL